ncbi:EEF1A lysine methyltransferase 2 isoform X2 [Corythoichthys intestinalis]|uniref:EEF1A lysine methyltransferase 2 isoform X2 n=1 Tax=Corythoichthys intestinalis TaxID=161448 RepID=UPI0025A6286B|nr:EEF1A lysine methyltransferase 2 isoform X2 [Corythoichthys intestinalis]
MGDVVFTILEADMAAPVRRTHGSDAEADSGSETDFETSQLGTKEYWEDAYKKELETFKDIGDVGEIWTLGMSLTTSGPSISLTMALQAGSINVSATVWDFLDLATSLATRFGEESMSRVLRWMEKAKIPEEAAILDIGTGNGAFLVELEVDFCSGGLEGYDVCVDKGTFDAISLNPDNRSEAKMLYVQALKDSLKDQGLFSITSCNWTKEQLLERFGEGFKFVQELPTPMFHFGGKTGNSVTALIFKRVH